MAAVEPKRGFEARLQLMAAPAFRPIGHAIEHQIRANAGIRFDNLRSDHLPITRGTSPQRRIARPAVDRFPKKLRLLRSVDIDARIAGVEQDFAAPFDGETAFKSR